MEDFQVMPARSDPDWEQRRFQIEEARIRAGSGDLTGFVRQWETIHKDSLLLLQEELRALEMQRLLGERKRLEILHEHSQDARKSVLPQEEEQLDQQEDSAEHGSAEARNFDSEEIGASVGFDFWKEKALRLNRLLEESLQREDELYRQVDFLQRSSAEAAPLEDLHQQLHRADNFVHFLLKNAPITVAHQDTNLRYRFIYNYLSGIQPNSKDMIGRRDAEFSTCAGAAEADALKLEVMRRGLPAKREIVFNRSKFGMKALVMAVEPVFSGSGPVIGVNFVAMDITEEAVKREKQLELREEEAVQTAMETELHKTIQIAEETMRAKQLLATMSHEIRSPLCGVVSMAEILSTTTLDEDQRQLVDVMLTSGDLVLQLINDILDISSVESGALKLEAKKFRPREVVKNVLQMAVASAQSKLITLEGLVLDEVPFEVIGDVLRLRQIFINLISNAIKFTHKGIVGVVMRGIPPVNKSRNNSAAFEADSRDKTWLHCEVFDTGIGIPESSIPLLFNKYTQASATHARQYGGTGLGLAICKQLVELMGGELNVASKENEGSTFSFTLPCKVTILKAREHEKDALQSGYFKFVPASGLEKIKAFPYSQTFSDRKLEVKTSSMKGTSSNDSPVQDTITSFPSTFRADKLPKILLAEDDKVNVMVATSMLKRLGLKPEVVCNGEEAVKAVQRGGPYDLILMDVCMPVMDGLEATKRIRELQSGRCNKTPIIALTANALAEDVAECYAQGMDFFVAKPATFKRLEHALKKFLSHLLEAQD